MYRLRWLILILCPILLTGAGIQDMQRRILKARGAAPVEDITSNLEVYYAFGETSGTNVNDSTANNRDGTVTGGAGWSWTAGKFGNGLTLTTANNYVAVPYMSGLNPTTQSFTIALWVNPEIPVAGDSYVFGANSAGTNQRAAICIDGGGEWGQASGSWGCNPGSGVTATAVFHHIIQIWDSATDTATLWVDGVKGTGDQMVNNYSFTSFAGNWDVGRGLGTTGDAAGVYDEFRIYSRAFTDAEALALYNHVP